LRDKTLIKGHEFDQVKKVSKMDELLGVEGTRVLQFDGTSGYVSLGNPDEFQIEGNITMEACIRLEGDIRPGQRVVIHRNILAHGHDRMTEVKSWCKARIEPSRVPFSLAIRFFSYSFKENST
jgi:hypothetical protein